LSDSENRSIEALKRNIPPFNSRLLLFVILSMMIKKIKGEGSL